MKKCLWYANAIFMNMEALKIQYLNEVIDEVSELEGI